MNAKLTRDEVDWLGRELVRTISPHILERGYYYYENGCVSGVGVSEGLITARVRGTRLYHVQIEWNGPAVKSYCTCPYDADCKHIAAVFFEVYGNYGNPYAFLQDDPLSEAQQDISPFAKQGVQPKKMGQAEQMSAAPIPSPVSPPEQNGPPERWLAYFDQSANVFPATVHPYYYRSYAIRMMAELLTLTIAWPQSHRALYQLYVYLFTLRLVLRRFDEERKDTFDASYHRRELLMVSQNCVNALAVLLNDGELQQAEGLEKASGTAVASLLRALLFDEPTVQVDIVAAYQMVWSRWLQYTTAVDLEISLVQGRMEGSTRSDDRRGIWESALASLYILNDQDEAAISAISEPNAEYMDVYLLFLPALFAQEAWNRVHRWLRWASTLSHDCHPVFVQYLTDFWVKLATQVDTFDGECQTFLRDNLPTSHSTYTEYLLVKELYQTWVDYYLAQGAAPGDTHKAQLKQVEAKARHLILPLYHQAVERYVQLKNRDAYKLAVRLLVKLDKHYKKLKQVDRWQAFLERFVTKHARLRALQEEMRKKGLIE